MTLNLYNVIVLMCLKGLSGTFVCHTVHYNALIASVSVIKQSAKVHGPLVFLFCFFCCFSFTLVS